MAVETLLGHINVIHTYFECADMFLLSSLQDCFFAAVSWNLEAEMIVKCRDKRMNWTKQNHNHLKLIGTESKTEYLPSVKFTREHLVLISVFKFASCLECASGEGGLLFKLVSRGTSVMMIDKAKVYWFNGGKLVQVKVCFHWQPLFLWNYWNTHWFNQQRRASCCYMLGANKSFDVYFFNLI